MLFILLTLVLVNVLISFLPWTLFLKNVALDLTIRRWRGATEGEIFAYIKPATSLSSRITRTKKEQIRRLAPLINYSSRFLRILPRTASTTAIPPRQTAMMSNAVSPVAGEGTNSSGFVSRSIICESSSIQSE